MGWHRSQKEYTFELTGSAAEKFDVTEKKGTAGTFVVSDKQGNELGEFAFRRRILKMQQLMQKVMIFPVL
mgnify:CR=1 FL=1